MVSLADGRHLLQLVVGIRRALSAAAAVVCLIAGLARADGGLRFARR